MAVNSEIRKQYMSLVRNIKSFSDGQAYLVPSEDEEDCLTKLIVAIAPNDGLYKGGTFKFKIELPDDYPHVDPPIINCLTKVYHPNIDVLDDYSDGSICLNLMDELWSPDLTLEDYVQGLLFMFYNPNIDDPLSPVFGNGEDDEEDFAENVLRSMKGEEIDGYEFDNVLSGDEDGGNAETPPKDDDETANEVAKATTKEEVLYETTPTTDAPRTDKDSISIVPELRDETTGQELPEMTAITDVTKATTTISLGMFPWQPLKTWTFRAVQLAAIYVAIRAGASVLTPAVSMLFRTRYMPVR